MEKRRNYIFLILLLLIVGISIGYAALTTTLNINGNTTIEKASWDIHFENLVIESNSVSAIRDAEIDSTKTLIEYSVQLIEPGDFYEFTVDIVNNGSIDAMISEVLKQGISSEQEKYIEYVAAYSDLVLLTEKDYLKSGEKENIRVRVKYKDDIEAVDLPTDESSFDFSFSVTYIQADSTAVERNRDFVCKRAEELHVEECTYSDPTYYCSGAGYTASGSKGTTKISYGSLGTEGTLVSGDAFDCDVNGDDKFDSETERFYYVTDLASNSQYAVLIYYNNISSGAPSNMPSFAYNTNFSATEYYGPQSLILQLPTTSKWGRISLVNGKRNITDEENNIRIRKFDYSSYSARFLTTDELERGCNVSINSTTGELDGCNYLFENTKYSSNSMGTYGYWLETVSSTNPSEAWRIRGGNRRCEALDVTTASPFGARPVIEVLKGKIKY